VPEKEKLVSNNSIILDIRKIPLLFELLSFGLLVISIFGQSLKYWTIFENAFGLVPLFNFAVKHSVSTIYGVLLLFVLALLLGTISAYKVQKKESYQSHWIFLTILTLYLSINRGTQVHNLVISPLKKVLRNSFGVLQVTRIYTTIISLGLMFLLFFRKFYLSLPKKTRSLLKISTFVYLVGFTLLASNIGQMISSWDFIQTTIISISKFIEMTGIVLLIYTCLNYLDFYYDEILIKFLDTLRRETDGKPDLQNQEQLISSESNHARNNSQLTVYLRPKKIINVLLIISFLLALTHLFAKFSKYFGLIENGLGLIPMMDMDRESNVPTIFSVQILFIAALLLILISILDHKRKNKFSWHWTGLAIGFLFMTYDEGVSVHELLTYPVRKYFNEGLPSFLSFAWIIPIGIIVIVLAIFYFRFVLDLPKKIRRMVIISGIVYLCGSVGMEMVGGMFVQAYTYHNFTYHIIVAIEETLEMAGIILLIYSLAVYINRMNGDVFFKTQQ